jgi:biotin carboxyl carrier protein
MENELRAPVAAVVRAVRAAPGSTVEKGAVLVEFEAPSRPAESGSVDSA